MRDAKIDGVRREDLTPRLAARLVAEQFPHWAELPVSAVPLPGWDNATFRLGEELVVRIPSAPVYAAQVEKEHQWLPVLRRSLPLLIPEPVALGRPAAGFPMPWAVYRWIDGEPASVEGVAERSLFAADLAQFLRALQTVDARGAPPAGPHSFFRGDSLATYSDEARRAITALADRLDAGAANILWDAALSSRWDAAPVWVHGDVTPSNLLVRDGRLRAVIDFGCCAAGDPACDLMIAWTFLDGEGRDVFRRLLPLDAATWTRGRAWTLWKAMVTMLDDEREGRGADGAVTARRFGWSGSAWQVVGRVLADGAAPSVPS